MKVNNFLIIGNDKKMQKCKNRLIARGFSADIAEKDTLSRLDLYDCVILPLPTISNGCISGTVLTLEDIIGRMKENQYLFCGNIDTHDYNNCLSYYYNESFLIKNSYLTAQGVLRLILECVDYGLYGIKAAVIGYGRCGKAIAALLRSAGMDVTVFSRRTDTMTQAYFDGFSSENVATINDYIHNYNVIVNTVPSNVINETGVKNLSPENIYIEVASKPYGLNISDADLYNFKYILAKSLPGRFTPESAGINIADTVIEISKEV